MTSAMSHASFFLCILALGFADGEHGKGQPLASTVQRDVDLKWPNLVGTGRHATNVFARNACADRLSRIRGGEGGSIQEPRTMSLVAATCPDKALALTNHVYLNPADREQMFGENGGLFVQIGGFVFAASENQAVNVGRVAFNSAQRKTLKASTGEDIQVAALVQLPQNKIHAASLELAVDFAGRVAANEALPAETLAAKVLTAFEGQVLTIGQHFLVEMQGLNLQLTVKNVLTFKETPPAGSSADSAEVRALWSGGQVMRTGLMGIVGPACKVAISPVKGSLLKVASAATGAAGHCDDHRRNFANLIKMDP